MNPLYILLAIVIGIIVVVFGFWLIGLLAAALTPAIGSEWANIVRVLLDLFLVIGVLWYVFASFGTGGRWRTRV